MISPKALSRWFAFLGWPRTSAHTLKLDLSAALTGAVIVLPQAIAFASIAGLPPQYGFLDDAREAVKQSLGRVLSRFAMAGKAYWGQTTPGLEAASSPLV